MQIYVTNKKIPDIYSELYGTLMRIGDVNHIHFYLYKKIYSTIFLAAEAHTISRVLAVPSIIHTPDSERINWLQSDDKNISQTNKHQKYYKYKH